VNSVKIVAQKFGKLKILKKSNQIDKFEVINETIHMNSKIVNYLLSIRQILLTCSKVELDIYTSFLEVGQRRNKPTTSYILAKAILKKPTIEAEELQRLLGDEITDQALYKGLTRVKEKLLESLILDTNIRESDKQSDMFINSVHAKKKMMQVVVLYSRGLEKEGRKLLERLINQGKKYELYDELYEAIHWIRNENGLRFGQKKYDRYTEELMEIRTCRDGLYEARNLYYDYYLYSDRNGEVTEKRDRVTKTVNRLKILVNQTNSDRVRFFYCLMLSEKYALNHDAGKTDKLAKDLLALLKAPSLNMDLKKGIAYSDIADMMLSCSKPKEALSYAAKAKNFFEEASYNYFIVEDIEIRALLLTDERKKALGIIDTLMENETMHASPLVQCKYNYYKACILFEKGRYAESIQFLGGLNELKKDKYCWNVVIRILLILNFIEVENYDVADNEIDSFRKYLNRIAKRGVVGQRYSAILDMFVTLRKNGWNFDKMLQTNRASLLDLTSDDDAFRWDPKSPELVRFDKWLEQKGSKQLI